MRLFRRQLIPLVALLALLSGCNDKGYSQATPDDVLKTARLMVEQGDADRLGELLYADTPELRQLLGHMGGTMGLLADLGDAVQKQFPEDVARLRAEAEAAAKEGKASSFIGRLAGLSGQAGRRARAAGGGPANENPQELFNKVLMELMSDPYAWLTRSADRLSTVAMTDDTAAIMWDGKPAFGVGLTMKLDRGRWYVVLPITVGPFARVMPDTPEEWEILGYLFDALDQALIDMSKDVRSGQAARLEDVARLAGEKAFVPAIMVFFAYERAQQAQKREKN